MKAVEYKRGRRFKVGPLTVELSGSADNPIDLEAVERSIRVLENLLCGLSSPREAELASKLFLGETFASMRQGSEISKQPCGCRDKR